MKEDISVLIVQKITLLVPLLASIVGLVMVINNLIKSKKDERIQIVREQSAGATAIAQIRSEQEVMKKLIEDGRLTTDQLKNLIEKLEDNYSRVLDRFVDYVQKK